MTLWLLGQPHLHGFPLLFLLSRITRWSERGVSTRKQLRATMPWQQLGIMGDLSREVISRWIACIEVVTVTNSVLHLFHVLHLLSCYPVSPVDLFHHSASRSNCKLLSHCLLRYFTTQTALDYPLWPLPHGTSSSFTRTMCSFFTAHSNCPHCRRYFSPRVCTVPCYNGRRRAWLPFVNHGLFCRDDRYERGTPEIRVDQPCPACHNKLEGGMRKSREISLRPSSACHVEYYEG